MRSTRAPKGVGRDKARTAAQRAHHHGDVLSHLVHLAPVDDGLLELCPLEKEQVHDNGVGHELVVGAQLRAREVGDPLGQRDARPLHVPCQERRQRPVRLDAVAPVPVPPVGEGLVGRRQGLAGPPAIPPKGRHARRLQERVQPLPRAQLRHGEDGVVGRQGGLLVRAAGAVPGDGHEGGQDLRVPGLLPRLLRGVAQLPQHLVVVGREGGQVGVRERAGAGVREGVAELPVQGRVEQRVVRPPLRALPARPVPRRVVLHRLREGLPPGADPGHHPLQQFRGRAPEDGRGVRRAQLPAVNHREAVNVLGQRHVGIRGGGFGRGRGIRLRLLGRGRLGGRRLLGLVLLVDVHGRSKSQRFDKLL